jgi:hypothetical protein
MTAFARRSTDDVVGEANHPAERSHPVGEFEPSKIVWCTSTASGGSNCVEVAFAEDSVLVRDSKDRSSPALEFTLAEWSAFLTGVQRGEFDLG